MQIFKSYTKHLQSLKKDLNKTVGGLALTKYPLIMHTMAKNAKFTSLKNDKNNLTMLKPHAHHQTLNKTPVKFKKDQKKIVGGVALTNYSLLR